MLLIQLISFMLLQFQNMANNNENKVLELGDENFNTTLSDHKLVMAMFYAPWCIKCQKTKPIFETAADTIDSLQIAVTLVKVDCTYSGKNMCKEYDVKSVPSFKIFRNGKYHQDYKGKIDAIAIIDHLKAQAETKSRKIEKFEDVQKLLTDSESLVLGIFTNESSLMHNFLEMSEQLYEQYTFAHTSNGNIIEEYPLEHAIVIVLAQDLQNQYEDPFKILQGNNVTKEQINHFITKNYYGLLGHRRGKNRVNFHFPIVIAYYKRTNKDDKRGFFEWKNKLLQFAAKYKDNITFAVSPRSLKEFKEYGIIEEVDDDSDVIVARDAKNRKFIYDDDFLEEEFEEFVNDVLNGKLKPYWKSEVAPFHNNGPVKTAVANNFEQLVLGSKKDVFIGFYSPHCPHCISLAGQFDKLGEMLQGEDVDIIKMDATSNDIPYPFEVNRYPCGYWLPKFEKNLPQKYVGGYNLEDVLKFIAGHATVELKKYDRNGNRKDKVEL